MSETAQVFVDLSNVAKDPLLGYSADHAALGRWDRLQAVWIRERGPAADFLLIGDQSLPRALSPSDRSRLEALVKSGLACLVPDADVEILRRAMDSRGTALSNDRYVDHRRTAGLERARLVGWTVRGENVRLQDRSLDRLLSAVISARAYKQELKSLGLAENAKELSYRWYCRNAACSVDLVAVPQLVKGAAMCPWCDAFLDQGEPWVHPIWIKVQLGATEITRFVLEHGESVFVGRGSGSDVVTLQGLATATDDVRVLDERHCELRNDFGALKVRDNHSSGGTSLRRPGAGELNRLLPPMPVPATSFTTVGKGTKIVLGGSRFVVQVSGASGS